MKHIHFIGICGVGMSALSVLWKKKGWKVTGSDVGFYPPVSTHLEKHKIDFYPGWHPEKMGKPDLVVVGNVAGSKNSEWLFVQEKKIPFVSYPELIAKNLIKKNSVVCAGTYGKTTTTALLAWIFKNAGLNPAYMFGGVALDMAESADDPEGSEWSVLEGDEYKTARWDDRAKFFSYKPTHLLLTAVNWDHADLYPTEESYLNAFRELVGAVPKTGLIVACADNKNAGEIMKLAKCKVVTYGKTAKAVYRYADIKQTKDGLSFIITRLNTKYQILNTSFGDYMAENICAAFALATEIGIGPEKIIEAIQSFHGLRRRMEKRGETQSGADIFDDIAHSPTKAKSVLETLKNIYPGKIYAIFEPNTGSRQAQSAGLYDGAFSLADEVLIPRLTKIKATPATPESARQSPDGSSRMADGRSDGGQVAPGMKHLDGTELGKIIGKTHSHVLYFEDDGELLNYLKLKTRTGDAVVFLGSHGFRGMIEQLTNR